MDGKKCPHNSIQNVQNFQNVNNREVIIIEHIQTKQEYLNKPSNLEKVPGSISLSTSGQPIYLSPDISGRYLSFFYISASADIRD